MRYVSISLLLSLALSVASSASPSSGSKASEAGPVPLASVRLNGWYPCNPDTFSNGNAESLHDDEYYLETKRHRRHEQANRRHHHRHKAGKQSGAADHSNDYHVVPFPFRIVPWSSDITSGNHRRQFNRNGKSAHNHGKTVWKPQYECAQVRVPMCYNGICQSNREIDVFVKRVMARHPSHSSSDNSRPPKALWVLQGGPGASSVAMESLMQSLYDELNESVSIYTMDHRGTGRSFRLECSAAQAATPGSPAGTSVSMEELPACMEDVRFQIDNQTAAFSVTSAAMDLHNVIGNLLKNEHVYVYGLSYGTYLVERLMHLNTPQIKGFSIDGIVSESGSTIESRSTYSNWDHDVGVVGQRFFDYCMKHVSCAARFPGVERLSDYVKQLYKTLDEAAQRKGTNECADVLASAGVRPSNLLRVTFGEMLQREYLLASIPAIIYRAGRCSKEDVRALQSFVDNVATSTSESDVDLEEVLYTSEMLYSLIVFSEMWETPTPNKTTLVEWYEESVMASGMYAVLPYYCVFTGSREQACNELKNLPQSSPLIYARDQYWNVSATLPENVSTLLMSGGFDVQTREMYGEKEFRDLRGGPKMHVIFETAGHCATFSTWTRLGQPTCGIKILASFILSDGQLDQVDTSCVSAVIPLSLDDSPRVAGAAFGTASLYD